MGTKISKPAAKPSRLELTAYHEAGHAVVSVLERRPIIAVTIEPDGEYLGRVLNSPMGKSFQPEIDSGRRTRSLIEAEIRICFAGCLAESKRVGREVRAGAEQDLDVAANLATYATGSVEETSAYLEWLMVATRQLIAQKHHWKAIETLAAQLVLQTTLSGRAAKKVIIAAAFPKIDLSQILK